VKFTEITAESIVYPGEYVYHTPSKTIVLVGSFSRSTDAIRVMKEGRLMEDKIDSFQKILLSQPEHKEFKNATGKCSGCKGK
jgi:hypothetical protein